MTPILIDTDPGQDDAVAILLALAHADRLDVRAITAVAGNVPVMLGAANAARVTALAGAPNVPVFAGAAAPLLFPLETAEFVCGPDGLAGADIPPAAVAPRDGHGVDALIRLARETDGLTVCALGPLTNVALALRLAPDIARRLRRIVVMGGARDLGNMTPAAEYNFHVDPHAAAIVSGAGVPVTLIGLHVTQEAVAGPEAMARLAALGNRAGAAVHGWLTRRRAGGLGPTSHPLHDPCVVAWLLWPELFSGRDCVVEIETGAGATRGRSTIDWHGRLEGAANAHVVGTIDSAVFFARLIEALGRLP